MMVVGCYDLFLCFIIVKSRNPVVTLTYGGMKGKGLRCGRIWALCSYHHFCNGRGRWDICWCYEVV